MVILKNLGGIVKKRVKVFLGFFLVLFVGYTLSVHADSGWDGSYDSGSNTGGSSWDSSDWSGSDWDHSDWGNSSLGSYSSGSSDLADYIILIVVIIMIFAFASSMSRKDSNISRKKSGSSSDSYQVSPYNIDKIKEVLPSFDQKQFQDQIYELYKKIQTAWMDFDYETLRKYTTGELYNQYHSQLVALHLKKQKNIMRDFELTDFEIVDMEKNGDTIALKVRLLVECFDYIVDQNEKVIRGKEYSKLVYDYEMTVIKGLSTKENVCPNCNAPLENLQSTVCPYCDSVIISDHHDWVLAKKQMIHQKWKV